MVEDSDSGSNRYRIGAVSRLTGISADTLRIWERRYAAVSPQRSPRGGRLYSPQDVVRLRLMKQLVDTGDAIGEVARLDTKALQERAAASVSPPAATPAERTPCRLRMVGESLAHSVQEGGDSLSGITLVDSHPDIADLEAGGVGSEVDVLVIEQATLHEDTATRVLNWLSRAKAAHALVVYRYASAQALQRLPASKCSVLRAPVDPQTLQAHCLVIRQAILSMAQPPETTEDLAVVHPAPPRRYDDETLARVATLSSTVKCECPQHLAELITGLVAFEQYSSECESRNPRDAALHAFLYATASQARHMIENALTQVIETEGISL